MKSCICSNSASDDQSSIFLCPPPIILPQLWDMDTIIFKYHKKLRYCAFKILKVCIISRTPFTARVKTMTGFFPDLESLWNKAIIISESYLNRKLVQSVYSPHYFMGKQFICYKLIFLYIQNHTTLKESKKEDLLWYVQR